MKPEKRKKRAKHKAKVLELSRHPKIRAAAERLASHKRVRDFGAWLVARGMSKAEAWAMAISKETGIELEKCRAKVDQWMAEGKQAPA